MKQDSHALWWVSPLVVGVLSIGVIIGGLVLRQSSVHDQELLTATGTATIQPGAVEESHCSGSDRCRREYRCEFTYTFAPAHTDEEYSGSSSDNEECNAKQEAGTQRTVYYDPDDPTDSILVDPGSSEQYAWLALVIPGGLGIAYGVLACALARRRRLASARETSTPQQ